MNLRPFKYSDYDTLIDWIDSEQLNYLWGGPAFSFPLDHSQISQHSSRQEVNPFIVEVDDEDAGYVELYRKSEDQFRICRVFISHLFRGKGLAKPMLSQLIRIAVDNFNAKLLTLAVFEHNQVAKHCYESLGFEVVAREMGTRSFDGEAWNLLRMERRV